MASSSNNLNNSVASNDNAQDKDTQSLLPHLESLERMMNLPMVGAAWQQGQDVYGKVKGNNRLFNWALSTAEDCVTRAVTITSPIVSKFDRPIQYVDQTLVKGIDKLEVSAPIIKDTPSEIYNQAKTKVIETVHPHIEKVVKLTSAGTQKASSLKDLAWQKANEVLATQYGSLAVNGVDSTTALAERLLEYYFPNKENEVEEENVFRRLRKVANSYVERLTNIFRPQNQHKQPTFQETLNRWTSWIKGNISFPLLPIEKAKLD